MLGHYGENIVQRVGRVGKTHRLKQFVQRHQRPGRQAVNDLGHCLRLGFEAPQQVAVGVGHVGEGYENTAADRKGRIFADHRQAALGQYLSGAYGAEQRGLAYAAGAGDNDTAALRREQYVMRHGAAFAGEHFQRIPERQDRRDAGLRVRYLREHIVRAGAGECAAEVKAEPVEPQFAVQLLKQSDQRFARFDRVVAQRVQRGQQHGQQFLRGDVGGETVRARVIVILGIAVGVGGGVQHIEIDRFHGEAFIETQQQFGGVVGNIRFQ